MSKTITFVTGVSVEERPPMCYRMTELFFGPEGDGRSEDQRAEREAQAKHYCTICPYRWPCLERVAIIEFRHAANGVYGVVGGMSEGERKKFYEHMAKEGYDEVPIGRELFATVSAFYRAEIKRKLDNAKKSVRA